MVKVKICGIRSADLLDVALDSGGCNGSSDSGGAADFIGLMFAPQSKRLIDMPLAASLSKKARGKTQVVAVVTDATDDFLAEIMKEVSPDFIQAHGAETPARVAEIKTSFGVKVIKALGVATKEDINQHKAYQAADWILFDSAAAAAAVGSGGTGESFDWGWLAASNDLPQKWILAGGLNESNLASAVRTSGAGVVDVSSGVEVLPGEKSAERVRRFQKIAKTL